MPPRPQNRDPLNSEQDACIGYLRNQVALIRPKIIVCLGRVAAIRLIKEDFKISKEHGQWFEKAGIHMTALFHPGGHPPDPRRRPETFEDLKASRPRSRRSVNGPIDVGSAGAALPADFFRYCETPPHPQPYL